MHTNYEQAAREAGCSSIAEYFRKVYPSEIDNTYQVLDNLMKQIDVRTGRRVGSPP